MRARLVTEAYGQKDLIRMQDIKTKAAGNYDKEISLATTQSKIISDASKAKARAEAAETVFGKNSEVFNIFNDRAKELGGTFVRGEASRGYLAPIKSAPEKNKKLERGFEIGKFLPSEKIIKQKMQTPGAKPGGFVRGLDSKQALQVGRYSEDIEWEDKYISSYWGVSVSPIGSVDIGSGNSKYFNVKQNWDADSIAEVWKMLDTNSNNDIYKLVFTSGKKPQYKLGNRVQFKNDQTGHSLFKGQLVDYIDLGNLSELTRVYKKSSMYGYVYK